MHAHTLEDIKVLDTTSDDYLVFVKPQLYM